MANVSMAIIFLLVAVLVLLFLVAGSHAVPVEHHHAPGLQPEPGHLLAGFPLIADSGHPVWRAQYSPGITMIPQQ